MCWGIRSLAGSRPELGEFEYLIGPVDAVAFGALPELRLCAVHLDDVLLIEWRERNECVA